MLDKQDVGTAAGSDCQVLVVGAGPTGLVLAAELLARGISTRIIDKGDGAVLETRALIVHARTLEVLELMGLAGRFLKAGVQVRSWRFHSDGVPFMSLDMSRNGSRYNFALAIPQHLTERLLRERVAELGGSIEQGVELLAVEDTGEQVVAKVRDRTGAERTVRARYVVGCDGAHSCVRRALGVPFEGHPYAQDWLLADVSLDWSRVQDEVHAFFRTDGRALVFFPLPGGAWRIVIPFAGERNHGTPTLEEIQGYVDQLYPGGPLRLSEPTWLACFHCHRRSAETYRRGNVLLAGDAVHIHTPAGGQGMNTGITDAHNLAWKLALVASGHSPDWLLDTYGAERGPVAAEVLELTHLIVRLGTLRDGFKRQLRDRALPMVAGLPVVRRRTARRWGQLHVAYQSSSLTVPDGVPGGGPRPGERAPDIAVWDREGATTLYATLARGRHVLVVNERDRNAALDGPVGHADQVQVVRGCFAGMRKPGSVVLIRPDGYVAARGGPRRPAGVEGYLRRLFPTEPVAARSREAGELPPVMVGTGTSHQEEALARRCTS